MLRAVRHSGLTWGTQETPYSLFVTIRKRFLKDAKIGPTARPPTHTFGVDRGNQQYEQIISSDKENQLTIQTLKSSMERLRSDLESEVNNNEKLNNALTVSKALVNNLNTKYADAIEQVNKNAKISVDHDKTSKALKKAKEEIARLTNKTEESLKTISKLRETTIPEEEYTKILQQKYHLETKMQEADDNASIAEGEVFTYKEKNKKLSKEITNLMIALNNSKGCQDTLEKQISDSYGSNPVPAAKGSTPKHLTRKELKKLRQKTKKNLANLHDDETDTHKGDDNLNESVEDLIDPVKNRLHTDGNGNEDSASNNNNEPLDTLQTATSNSVPDAEGNTEDMSVINILTTIPAGRVQAEGSSNDSTAVLAGDSSKVTTILPHPTSAIQSQYEPCDEDMAGVPTKDPRTVNTAERDAFTEHLRHIVGSWLEQTLYEWLYNYRSSSPIVSASLQSCPLEIQRQTRYAEASGNKLGSWLNWWKRAEELCTGDSSYEWESCLSCLKNVELSYEADPETDIVLTETMQKQCVLFSGVKELLKELTVDKIESICKLATQVFSNSVCTLKLSDLGKETRTITPPWGLFGLGYSLRDCSFTCNNYLSHHALGTLAAQLVRRGMLAAATEGEVDHGSHGDADQQQPQAVDAKLE